MSFQTPQFSNTLKLEVDGTVLGRPATAESVREALLKIQDDGFAILSSAQDFYLQTAMELGGYIVEKCEGGDLNFYRAVRKGAEADDSERFEFEEAVAIFFAYGAAVPMPCFLEWKRASP